jgi:hypothetical protein
MHRFLLLLCATLATTTVARAQTLTLSPAVVPLRGERGQTTTQTLTLVNGLDVDLEFVLEAKDVVVRNGKRVFVAPGEVRGSIAATAVFSPRTVTVPAHESRAARVTVTLAEGAQHRAMIALFRGTTRIASGNGLATASLGTLLTFSVSDAVSLQSSPLSVTPQTRTRNTTLEQVLSDDGAEPVVTKGVAVILDAKGAIVGRTSFDPQRLLPGERLAFRSEYPGELGPGKYRVLSTFEFAGRSLTRSAELVVR